MANKCAICGADINLIQTQKLSDGNCICRKNCRKKGFKSYDYVHSNLPGVKAHLAQVERGTKLWEHYFIPREKTKDKSKKLKRFGTYLYVAEDIGLMAYIQNDYKFMMFGKNRRALRCKKPTQGATFPYLDSHCHRCGLYPLPHHSGQDESKVENGPFSAGGEQLYESRQHEHHREPRSVPV